jgi:hypothetical protein
MHHQGVRENSFALILHRHPLTVGTEATRVIMDIFVITNVTAPANGFSLFHNFSIPFKYGVELVTSAFFWGFPKITQTSQVLLSATINISVNYYYCHHHRHHHSHHLIGSYKYLYYCYCCNNNNNNNHEHSQYHPAVSLSNSSAVRL